MQSPPADRWILKRMADELLDRLDGVSRSFANALVIGGDCATVTPELRRRGLSVTIADPGYSAVHWGGGVQCDEDRLPFADFSFDLILAIGTLDTVNDLPGALVLIRRMLRADGLFLGSLSGAGGLPVTRATMSVLSGVARFHPQIDVRAAGDLLGRAGFALPVVDIEMIDARYGDLQRLTADLRANGLRNVLTRRQALSHRQLASASAAFANAGTSGRTTEQFSIVFLTGWAPKTNVQADR